MKSVRNSGPTVINPDSSQVTQVDVHNPTPWALGREPNFFLTKRKTVDQAPNVSRTPTLSRTYSSIIYTDDISTVYCGAQARLGVRGVLHSEFPNN
jgi:hypothetical protein